MADRVPAPSTEAGRAFIEKLRADDAGFTQLTSGRFHLGAVVTDAEDAVAAIEAAARDEGRQEAVREIRAKVLAIHPATPAEVFSILDRVAGLNASEPRENDR